MNNTLLESERLIYRRFKENDFTDLHKIMSNKNVRKYLPGKGAFSEQQTAACLRNFNNSFSFEKPDLIYALILKDTNKLIGYTGVSYEKDFNNNEILYGLNEDYWGKGYAFEAALKMKKLAIDLGLDMVIAFTDVKNLVSEKIIRKLGYTYLKTVNLWGLNLKYYELKLKGEHK